MRLVKRLMPVSIYDITQVEAYLTHMASKGYFIKKIKILTSFEKGTPEKTKYRLEPVRKQREEPAQEMLLFYEEQGWEYICTTGLFHVFKSTREDATEIHTDSVTQGETFDFLNKQLKFLFWLITALYLFSGGMILYSSFINDRPLYFSTEYGGLTSKVTIIILFVFTIIHSHRDYRKMKRLKEQLESGVRMNHNHRYKPRYQHCFEFVLPLLILIPMFSINSYAINASWEKSLLEYDGNLPTISITELEKNPDFSFEYDDESEGPYENYISYHWSELAPQVYNVEERGLIEGQMWEDNSGTYSPSMETEFYRMRFQFLAKPLFEEIIDYHTERNHYEKIEYHELLDTKFDQATLVSTDNTQMFFGRIGRKVIFIKYYGHEDLKAVINKMFEAVNNFEEA